MMRVAGAGCRYGRVVGMGEIVAESDARWSGFDQVVWSAFEHWRLGGHDCWWVFYTGAQDGASSRMRMKTNRSNEAAAKQGKFKRECGRKSISYGCASWGRS